MDYVVEVGEQGKVERRRRWIGVRFDGHAGEVRVGGVLGEESDGVEVVGGKVVKRGTREHKSPWEGVAALHRIHGICLLYLAAIWGWRFPRGT